MQQQPYTFDDIVGPSDRMRELKDWGLRAAASPSTVLIHGESGTGKELFAQAIHNASSRRDRRFIAINCAAMPETLVESELFGHEEGSFTGAKKGGSPGKFELADGGTIFLDEIGDMSPQIQTKLLRVLQEKKVTRVGSAVERHIDIRVIAATNKDLHAEVQLGHFRQDLFYRLNVLELTVPPLRERIEDVEPIALHLMLKLCAKLNRPACEMSPEFVARLQAYHWPGNVRELENCLERAIIKAGAASVLTAEILELGRPEPQRPSTPGPDAPLPASTPVKTLRDTERDMIAEALMKFEGNIQKTAANLGIARNTLYRKMKEYGLS